MTATDKTRITYISLADGADEEVFVYGVAVPQWCELEYPSPALRSSAKEAGEISLRLPGTAAHIKVRRKVVPSDTWATICQDLQSGTLSIDTSIGTCRVRSRPSIVFSDEEDCKPFIGCSPLMVESFAVIGGFERLQRLLDAASKDDFAHNLQMLSESVTALAGFRKTEDSPLSVFEIVDAPDRDTWFMTPLVAVAWEIPDLETNEPMCKGSLIRQREDRRSLSISFQASSLGERIADQFIMMPPGTDSVGITCNQHMTDTEFRVYLTNTGELLQHFKGRYLQGLTLSLTGIYRTDEVPLGMNEKDGTTELIKRQKQSSSLSSLQMSSEKAWVAKQVNETRDFVRRIITSEVKAEDLWLARSIDGQLNAIKWLKEKIDDPRMAKSIIADPFFGSEAFIRTLMHVSSDNANVTVLVSPGNWDPDAKEQNTRGEQNAYLGKLVQIAEANAHLISGKVAVFHIKRGEGRTQAFHDRYLCQIDHYGNTHAWLLSNSLSKAAGEWPFCTSKLGAAASKSVQNYLDSLLRGFDSSGRELSVHEIWNNSTKYRPLISDENLLAIEPALKWLFSTPNWLSKAKETNWICNPSKENVSELGKLISSKWNEDPPSSPQSGVQLLHCLFSFLSLLGCDCWPNGLTQIMQSWTSEWTTEALRLINENSKQTQFKLVEDDRVLVEVLFSENTSPKAMWSAFRIATSPSAMTADICLARLVWMRSQDDKSVNQLNSPEARFVFYKGLMCLIPTSADELGGFRAALSKSKFWGVRLHSLLYFEPDLFVWNTVNTEQKLVFRNELEQIICSISQWRFWEAAQIDAITYDRQADFEEARKRAHESLIQCINCWPENADLTVANAVVSLCNGRMESIYALQEHLRERPELRVFCDLLLKEIGHRRIETISKLGLGGANPMFDGRGLNQLRVEAQAFAETTKEPTNQIADKLNPILSRRLALIELYGSSQTFENLEDFSEPGTVLDQALVIAIFGLYSALYLPSSIPRKFAQNLAADYAGALARILRSPLFHYFKASFPSSECYKVLQKLFSDLCKSIGGTRLTKVCDLMKEDPLLQFELAAES